MPRTTVDIAAPLLAELKSIQRRQGKTLSAVVQDALARHLAEEKRKRKSPVAFSWLARPMGLKVDLADKDAVYAALEGSADTEP